MIYFDNMSITKPDKRVLREIRPIYKKYWGNPSSIYSFGRLAKAKIESSRIRCAKALGCNTDELFFVNNSSFANNMIAKGLDKQKYNFTASLLSHHSLEQFMDTKIDETKIKIFSVPYINNETGERVTLQNNILYHLDLTATIGKIPINLHDMKNVIFATLNATKINGIAGCALLYIQKDYIKEVQPLVYGSQEQGMVGGTENVAGIVGMGKAIELATQELEKNNKQISKIISYIMDNIDTINYKTQTRNHIINFTFKHLLGVTAVQIFDQYGIAISAGSACNGDSEKPSHTLLQSAYSEEEALRTIRISVGKQNTCKEAQRFIKVLYEVIKIYDKD